MPDQDSEEEKDIDAILLQQDENTKGFSQGKATVGNVIFATSVWLGHFSLHETLEKMDEFWF